jgi:hypothetical protein
VFDCDAPVKRVLLTDGQVAPSAGPGAPPVTAPPTDLTAKTPGLQPPGQQTPNQQTQGQQSVPAPIPGAAGPAPQLPPNVQGEPKTMLEAAQQAKAATDKQMEKANANIKSSAEKTSEGFRKFFDCVGSFFKRCGDTTQ